MITEIADAELAKMRDRVHPRCVVCGPSNNAGLRLEFMASGLGEVSARFDCAADYEGYSGILHGGVVATLVDGAMTNCLFAQGVPAVTAGLTVRFRHPVVTGVPATVRAWIERSSSARHVLRAEIVQGAQIKTTAVGRFLQQDHLAAARH